MPRGKKFTAEQIIGKLREAEVGLAQGKTVPEVVRRLGVTEQTYYRWKREYGGLRTDQAKRRQTVEHVRDKLGRDVVTERRLCLVLGQARNTQRRKAFVADDEPQLVKRIVWMASEYGRYGYRRITALLRAEGWCVNHKRVERIWRQEGLKVPAKQPKRRRLWLGDGSCIRLRPTHRNHVWSYDFVMDRTADGRAFRMLTIVDEYTRECLAIDVSRKLTSEDVLERLSDLFVRKGVPDHIRSDNGSEFTAKRVREWLERVGVKTLYIEPGSPWENGYVESFNGKLRDELLAREVFDTLLEAKVLIERWRSLGRATLVIDTGSIHGGRSVERARSGRLTPADMQGGVFTLTSLGSYGIKFFTPVINHPEAAILGVGAIRMQPVPPPGSQEGFVLQLELPLSLTFDHGIVDGGPAARFLGDLAARIAAINPPGSW